MSFDEAVVMATTCSIFPAFACVLIFMRRLSVDMLPFCLVVAVSAVLEVVNLYSWKHAINNHLLF